MIDVLAPLCVMLGDNGRQSLDDRQLYLIADDEQTVPADTIEFKIGPSLSDSPEGVTVSVADLSRALREFGYTLEPSA